jgi:membrane carboxypeptidase/penicillin-binding protein PbpC
VQATCTRNALINRYNDSNGRPADVDTCPATRYLPTLAINQENLPEELSAILAILQPTTGEILALVGDSKNGFDPAHLPGHPPGSMLTPFVYLTAFTRGFNPASLLWDVAIQIPGFSIPDSVAYFGPVRLRSALANDYLNPAIQTMSQIGADNVWLTIQKMGLFSLARFAGEISPANCRGCSLLFNSGEVTLLELTNAYSVFANNGLMVGQTLQSKNENDLSPLFPVSILEISNHHGEVLLDQPNLESRSVISPQLAYLITNILSDESARWPSMGHPNPLEIGRPVGVKAGSTADRQDTWTIGYTPTHIVGVWTGNGNSYPQGDVPKKISAALWQALMKYITASQPAISWEIPSGISNIDVCDPSGLLPTRHCPTVVNEIFLSGNEPSQYDSLYQSFQINRETGLLATVFTPPELIEERVYMMVPSIANQWATQSNLPIPPESYDIISMPPIKNNAQITQPEMFENIRGEIEIVGTASGDDFMSYRLQVGQGLNPKVWIQVSEDRTSPVESDVLAIWDTNNLNGLYAIQMIVLRENRKVDTTTIQITVDNQDPEVSIQYPRLNQSFDYEFDQFITLQANVNDNIGLEAVQFFIDGSSLIQQYTPPFAVPWRLEVGEHTLRVKAIDMAGNTTEDTISFVVKD